MCPSPRAPASRPQALRSFFPWALFSSSERNLRRGERPSAPLPADEQTSPRLHRNRLHQVAMRDPTDQYDLPEHDTWQMNFAVDHKEVSTKRQGPDRRKNRSRAPSIWLVRPPCCVGGILTVVLMWRYSSWWNQERVPKMFLRQEALLMEYFGEKARRQDMDPPPMAKYRQSDYDRQTYLARLSSFSVPLSTLSGHSSSETAHLFSASGHILPFQVVVFYFWSSGVGRRPLGRRVTSTSRSFELFWLALHSRRLPGSSAFCCRITSSVGPN